MRARVALFALTGMLALLMVPTPASAVAWGPLQAKNNKVRAEASGSYYNAGYVFQRAYARYRDSAADGDAAFVNVSHHFFGPGTCPGAGSCWQQIKSQQTARVTTKNGWVRRWVSVPLKEEGSHARGVIKVCVDRAYMSDVCSRQAIPSFAY